LIGRAEQTERLRNLLVADEEQVVVACISGEAGIGKTTLSDWLAAEATAAGHRVLRGAATVVFNEPITYAPIAQALRVIGHPFAADAATRNRMELFERVLVHLTEPTASRRQILILEDLHWADASTLELVGFLARNLPAGHLLVLTFRDDQEFVDPGARNVLRVVMADRRVVRIPLGRFTEDEMRLLGESSLGRPLRSAEEQMLRRADGNPFIAHELLDAERSGEVPPRLADLLYGRAGRLSPGGNAAIRALAVLGRPSEPQLLRSMLRADMDDSLVALAECLAAGILVIDERRRYAFRHALLEDAVRTSLLPGELEELHARAAIALSENIDEQANSALTAEWATHWYAAGQWEQAFDAALLAARTAEAVFAFDEVWRQLSRAVELHQLGTRGAADISDYELFARAAQAARWAGHLGRAVELARSALTAASSAEQRARANERLALILWELNDIAAAELALQAAATELGDSVSALSASITVSRATIAARKRRYDDVFALASQAVMVAQATGARAELGQGLTTLGIAESARGNFEDGIAHIRAGLALSDAVGDGEGRRRATNNLAVALLAAGRTQEAAETAAAGLRQARRSSAISGLGVATVGNTITMLFIAGRWEECRRLSKDVLEGDVTPGQALSVHLVQAELAMARGNFDDARAGLEKATVWAARRTSVAYVVDLRLAQAKMSAFLGEAAETGIYIRQALVVFSELADLADPRELARAALTGLQLAADITQHRRRWVTAWPSDPDLERDLVDAGRTARKLRPTLEVDAYAITAEAEFARARRAGEAGLWRSAVEAWSRLERPLETSYTQYRLAEQLMESDRAQATTVLRSAAHIARELGALPLLALVDDLARRARITLDPPSPISPRADPDRLTRREQDVLREMAAGRTNKEIARSLFVSVRTIDVHVANVIAKLEARNRTEAVAFARRRGLLKPD